MRNRLLNNFTIALIISVIISISMPILAAGSTPIDELKNQYGAFNVKTDGNTIVVELTSDSVYLENSLARKLKNSGYSDITFISSWRDGKVGFMLPTDIEEDINWDNSIIKSKTSPLSAAFRIIITNRSNDSIFIDEFQKKYKDIEIVASIPEFKFQLVDKNEGSTIAVIGEFNKKINKFISLESGASGGIMVCRYTPELGFIPVAYTISDTGIEISTPDLSAYVAAIAKENKSKTAFKDVPDNHWAKPFIQKAVSKSLVKGAGDGFFKPEEPVTRAEFVQMIINAADKGDLKGKSPDYSDVKETDWYYDTVSKAKEAGYLKYFSASDFKPNNPITRQEMASVIAEVIYQSSIKITEEYILFDTIFKDYGDIDKSLINELQVVYKTGIMKGVSNTEYAPKVISTRAQAVTVMVRLTELLDMVK